MLPRLVCLSLGGFFIFPSFSCSRILVATELSFGLQIQTRELSCILFFLSGWSGLIQGRQSPQTRFSTLDWSRTYTKCSFSFSLLLLFSFFCCGLLSSSYIHTLLAFFASHIEWWLDYFHPFPFVLTSNYWTFCFIYLFIYFWKVKPRNLLYSLRDRSNPFSLLIFN